MTNKTLHQQASKVIKVGSSLAVTLPAKQSKSLGIKQGDYVACDITKIEPIATDELMQIYKKFTNNYGKTLENLKDR